MTITFEMIEKVLDATGADYYIAKQALTDSDGDVQEAIKAIEQKQQEAAADNPDEVQEDGADNPDEQQETAADNPDEQQETGAKNPFSEEHAEQLVDRLKEKVEKGNVDRIKISKKDKVLLDIPLNVGLIGGLIGLLTVPWAMILAALIAYGTDCKIEIIKSDGTSERL